jgi:hypothetical protein
VQPDGVVALLEDLLQGMGREKHPGARLQPAAHPLHALALEPQVADGDDLVQEDEVGSS